MSPPQAQFTPTAGGFCSRGYTSRPCMSRFREQFDVAETSEPTPYLELPAGLMPENRGFSFSLVALPGSSRSGDSTRHNGNSPSHARNGLPMEVEGGTERTQGPASSTPTPHQPTFQRPQPTSTPAAPKPKDALKPHPHPPAPRRLPIFLTKLAHALNQHFGFRATATKAEETDIVVAVQKKKYKRADSVSFARERLKGATHRPGTPPLLNLRTRDERMVRIAEAAAAAVAVVEGEDGDVVEGEGEDEDEDEDDGYQVLPNEEDNVERYDSGIGGSGSDDSPASSSPPSPSSGASGNGSGSEMWALLGDGELMMIQTSGSGSGSGSEIWALTMVTTLSSLEVSEEE